MSILHLVFARSATGAWAEAASGDAIVLAGDAVADTSAPPPATASERLGVLATDLRERGLLEAVHPRYDVLDDDAWLDWVFACRLTRTWP